MLYDSCFNYLVQLNHQLLIEWGIRVSTVANIRMRSELQYRCYGRQNDFFQGKRGLRTGTLANRMPERLGVPGEMREGQSLRGRDQNVT